MSYNLHDPPLLISRKPVKYQPLFKVEVFSDQRLLVNVWHPSLVFVCFTAMGQPSLSGSYFNGPIATREHLELVTEVIISI